MCKFPLTYQIANLSPPFPNFSIRIAHLKLTITPFSNVSTRHFLFTGRLNNAGTLSVHILMEAAARMCTQTPCTQASHSLFKTGCPSLSAAGMRYAVSGRRDSGGAALALGWLLAGSSVGRAACLPLSPARQSRPTEPPRTATTNDWHSAAILFRGSPSVCLSVSFAT